MGANLINKFLYPAPNPPHYECDSFPNHIVWIPRSDKKGNIPCMMLRQPGATNMIIYAHGNGCDIGDMKMELDYFSQCLKAHICAFELRGYGFNKGTPSETAINSDIQDVYTYFTETNPEGKFPSQNILFWGRSIGSGPTTWMVSQLSEKKVECAGLILQSPFTSIKAAAGHIAGSMVGAFVGNRWNNESRIKKIRSPVLLIHGKKDTLIPHSHSEALLAACSSRNKRLELSETADHNHFDFGSDIIRPAASFINELCSNSFNWGDKVNAKCPTGLYRIPEFAKKMHIKARKESKIREVQNPGSDFALGIGGNRDATSGAAWSMGVGWEERVANQANTAAEILKCMLESTPKKEWPANEIVQELRATCVTTQKEIARRVHMIENMETLTKLLECNETLLGVLSRYEKGGEESKNDEKNEIGTQDKTTHRGAKNDTENTETETGGINTGKSSSNATKIDNKENQGAV